MDAFISHASEDITVAARIEELLEEDGLTIWLDRSEIRLGVLLRKELQTAIKNSRVLILLWSKAAAKSRWVAAEVLTAFHLNRFIVACVRDGTQLPYFLQNTIYLSLQPRKRDWADRLHRAVRESPEAANEVPTLMSSQSPELQQAIARIARGQREVTDRLGKRDIQGAKQKQQQVDGITLEAAKAWPLEPMVLNLSGYHHKNAYMLKHWAAIQSGRPPKDRSLERAERYFFEALFVNPSDYSALNGLGSILIFERDLEAAEFFIRQAIALAEQRGIDYAEAKQDLAMILAFKQG
jgi:tetratricopeptide (TPR) repeat protein